MRRFLLTLPIALMLFVGAALPVQAAGIPLLDSSFSIVPKECQTCPCDYGAVLQLIQNLMNAGIAIGVIAFILVITYAGATFMLSGGNPETRTKARSMLINVVVGMIILLTAWLVVDFIMKTLYNETNYGPWNSILASQGAGTCIQAKSTTQIPGILGTFISGGISGAQGTSGATVTGGKCAIQSQGPCSVANLTPAFGSSATTFSKICSHESSGGVVLESTLDKTTDGQSVSFGAFQINITARNHLSVGGTDCANAFTSEYTASNHNVQIKDQRLYTVCKASAMDTATNIQAAAQLYHDHGLQPWLADKECGFP